MSLKVFQLAKELKIDSKNVVKKLLDEGIPPPVEKGKEKPSPKVIWDRFPKFVLGFIIASVLASLVDAKGANLIFSADALAGLGNIKNWLFAMAFVSIGLELDFGSIKQVGGAPLWCYIIVTVFNTVLALIVAQIIFGMLFPV